MPSSPEDAKKLLRAKDNKQTGKTEYICKACARDLTEAVEIFGRASTEASHKAGHVFEARQKVLEYAERCFEHTKRNPKQADMTNYLLMVGAVKEMKDLSE